MDFSISTRLIIIAKKRAIGWWARLLNVTRSKPDSPRRKARKALERKARRSLRIRWWIIPKSLPFISCVWEKKHCTVHRSQLMHFLLSFSLARAVSRLQSLGVRWSMGIVLLRSIYRWQYWFCTSALVPSGSSPLDCRRSMDARLLGFRFSVGETRSTERQSHSTAEEIPSTISAQWFRCSDFSAVVCSLKFRFSSFVRWTCAFIGSGEK